ncbi:hypothetical protein H8959_000993 [Pygathrix nigripes]
MAGAAGLTAEVSWKVLERRARTKRSGLAGWGAAPSTRVPGVVLLLKHLGGRQVAVPTPFCVCPRLYSTCDPHSESRQRSGLPLESSNLKIRRRHIPGKGNVSSL